MGTEFASYAFDDSLREEVRQVIHNTLDGHGKKAMSIKMDCKLDECDVVWAMTVSGPGDITDLNIETVSTPPSIFEQTIVPNALCTDPMHTRKCY